MSSFEECEIDERIDDKKPMKLRKKLRWMESAFNNSATQHKFFSRVQRYWTSGHESAGEERKLEDEQSPFVFPSCSQTLAYLQWWKAWKKKIISKSNKEKDYYETLQSRDLLQRLRVDVEIEAIEAKKHKTPEEAIAMTDVDPEYFTELCGRSVKEKFSFQQYICNTREILKTKLLIGQEKDYCIRIDQQFEQESDRLEKIQRRTRRYMNSFEEFLSKDHKRSMNILEKAEREGKLTEKIRIRRDELLKQFGQSRLDVYFWEDNWRMVKMCQMFLYRISPVAWRTKHDWLYQLELKKDVTPTKDVDLFDVHKTPEEATLEDLIELFERDISEAGPAELYFEDPFELVRIFRAIESQNLNALIHLESLAEPLTEMAITITMMDAQIKQEINEILLTINDLEDSIIKTEIRAANLEKYADYLLRGIFRHLVCSEEVLYLYIFVEDTYESCVAPNDANLDCFLMMKWIEKMYEKFNLQLDNMPYEIVRACEKEGFKQRTKAIKEAEDAAKKFELMHRLLDALKRIMELPIKKKRPLVQRSTPIVLEEKPPSVALEPTDEEAQYLTYFTDYCDKRDDFIEYRSKFPDDFDLTFQIKHNIKIGMSSMENLGQIQEENIKEENIQEENIQEEKGNHLKNKSTINENVTESADLFYSVYIPKDRISLPRYASSVT